MQTVINAQKDGEVLASVAISARTTPRSPRRFFFVYYQNIYIYRIKVSPKINEKKITGIGGVFSVDKQFVHDLKLPEFPISGWKINPRPVMLLSRVNRLFLRYSDLIRSLLYNENK